MISIELKIKLNKIESIKLFRFEIIRNSKANIYKWIYFIVVKMSTKKQDYDNKAKLKASLLSKGISFDLDLFEKIKRPFYDNQFVYGKTSDKVTTKNKLPQVLELGDKVVSAILRRENSPWNLKLEDDIVKLYNQDEFVQNIDLPERPAYFDQKLSDNTPTESIIAVAGADTPGFFLYPECHYFEDGTPCGFCSMKSTRKTVGKYMASEFTENNIREATKIFQNTKWRDIPLVSITMGTPATDEETIDKVIIPIKWMNETLNPKIPIHLLAHPPNDFKLLEMYKAAGVTSIAFNLEVFDKYKFEEVCPGKSKHYSYEKWNEALLEAKEVFGNFNVYCGLVWGLESIESTLKGHEYFMNKGIGIASNIFHADPRTILRNKKQPSEQQILYLSKELTNFYKEEPALKTIFSVSMRSTLDWEIKRGDLKE